MPIALLDGNVFDVFSLTTAIQELPVPYGMLGRMGLYTEESSTLPYVAVESKGGVLYIIPSAPRGAENRVAATPGAVMRTFAIPHYPLDAGIKADDITGVRAFGTEDTEASINAVVNDKMQILRNSHEATHEYGRVGGVKGVVTDADGVTVMYNLFNEFGVTESSVDFDFGGTEAAPNDNISLLLLEVIETIEAALQGQPYQYVMGLCGKTFYRSLITHPVIMRDYTNIDARFPLEQQREGIEYGNVVFRPYRGGIAGVPFIPDDQCRFFPVGVPDLFKEIMAPADFMETVGTRGKRLYVKQETQPFGRGVTLHSQSNILFMCTRPATLVKGVDVTV
jgi:hypothetical protein